ncbi:MAG: NAD+ synthase [Pseudomonadota bacterium]
MKIALCQINPVIGDFEYNLSLIRDDLQKAVAADCTLAVFPEMSLLGYPPKDLLEKPAFVSENLRQLERLASSVRDIQVLCGYVDRNQTKTGKPLINGVALLSKGRIMDKGGKRLLPTYDVFDEARYFEPAEKSLVFELEGKRVGVTICEDIWNVGDIEGLPRYSADPLADLEKERIELLVNLSASPYAVNKRTLRREILKKLSTRYRIPTLFCNQVGGNDELLFDGSSMAVDPEGQLILRGKEFETDLIIWDSRKKYGPIRDGFPTEEDSVLKGLIMGTRDYALKCGFKKVLIGLSGGIDSSLVAVIARRALGAENVLGVAMPSPYTSDMSREDSRKLADNLGIRFDEIPIDDLFRSYKHALAPLFKGLAEDETEENIQARIRGNLLMALSNKFGSLLLTTGNKSEMAMGYCTLYGDMSGGLAVISDIPKTLCYRIAETINREEEIIPERILTRPPSAELRPNQTDQDSLPPYDVLDRIIEASVVHNRGFDELVAMGYEPAMVMDVLRRLAVNEYKRRQAPPGLKITTKAFGYGRRYPIACGNQPY